MHDSDGRSAITKESTDAWGAHHMGNTVYERWYWRELCKNKVKFLVTPEVDCCGGDRGWGCRVHEVIQ
jgi:hypothetical protein